MRIRVHPNNKLNIYMFIIIIKVKKKKSRKGKLQEKKRVITLENAIRIHGTRQ